MARPADYGTKEQIFEIYSGVWGAAPDAEGVDYWVSAVESEEFSLASAAASFFDQPLVQEKYEGLAGDDLLAALYANIFKVTEPDAEGLAYWTERMEALGVSESTDDAIGTLVMEMIDGMWANEDAAETQALYANLVAASGQFYDFQVENGVQAYSEMDEDAQAQFLAAAQELTDSITADSTAEEIEAAVAEAGGAVAAPSGLTEAIEAYLGSQDALADFLVDALENARVAEAAGEDADAATGSNLETALDGSEAALGALVDGFLAEDRDNVREAMIVDALEEDQAAVESAQDDLAAAREDFEADANAAEKHLAAQYEARAAELEAAKEARDSAQADAQAELDAFEAAQEGVTFVDNAIVDGDNAPLAQFQPYSDSDGGRFVITAEGTKYEGLQAVVDVINDALVASDAVNTAREARNEARSDLGIEANGVVTPGGNEETGAREKAAELYVQVIGAGEALDTAEAALSDLEAAIADWRELVELNEQYADLVAAEEEALAAIQSEVDADPAGLGITVLDGNDSFTANSDVYLFDEAYEGVDGVVTLNQFGRAGEDKIYFGEGFTLVALGDGDDLDAGNVGDLNALEIFWEEVGTSVNLYVETETFGGNAAGSEHLVQITLTGIQGADITDELVSGYLSAGAVA